MKRPILHQFTEAALVGDASTDHAFLIRKWLRQLGFESEIYSEHCQAELEREVRPAAAYQPGRSQRHIIYHHAIGTSVVDRLVNLGTPLILIYHNITPPDFFARTDPALAKQLHKGREQLELLRPQTALALGDSHFNQQDLQQIGFNPTGVLPIVLDEAHYNLPNAPAIEAHLAERGPCLLFVGRIAPNKKQEDLLKLLYYYRRFEPEAHLVLVGSSHFKHYQQWLEEFAYGFDLVEAVTMTGHVTQQEMITYFRLADLYVSMSDHEGFGKPLIESMYFGLPVLAYASTAIPFTMGQAGVLFQEKNYEALAELVDLMIKDKSWRQRLIAQQKERVQAFLEPAVKAQWHHYLERLGYPIHD